ncbi:MAG: hypothetical protein A6F71_10180 [Cycloclasticus sp. symbiont of Poecilosclerida sp. M]|nr:MAG: hypothetical protein A6F71_10180 [Cycloclasticus sp. symbiont of Poecilosclerida sp. M]
MEINWTDQEIWQYWLDPENRNSIIDAAPLDLHLEIFQNEEEDPTRYIPSLNFIQDPRPRPDIVKCLNQHPYQSVGRLFWCHPKTKGEIVWATAFYIGSNRIMTAAHAFDAAQGYAGVFVPAMMNREDTEGIHYGSYLIRPSSRKQHPLYVPFEYKKPEYDICTVEAGMGKRLIHPRSGEVNINYGEGKRTEDIMIDESGLTPIEICCDSSPNFTSCTILGYLGSVGQQMEAHGCYYADSKSDDNRMAINFDVEKGMSGGPWLVECSDGTIKAIGCTAGTKNQCTLSPRFTGDLFEKIGLNS